MLSENQVTEAVCDHHKTHGYVITQGMTTKQRGHDIIATKQSTTPIELHIEAKGETSDRQGSARHGKAFNSAQVSDHVASAFFCAAAMLQEGVSNARVLCVDDGKPITPQGAWSRVRYAAHPGQCADRCSHPAPHDNAASSNAGRAGTRRSPGPDDDAFPSGIMHTT